MDYKKLGFKCGIEIHQQLNTHKLFCSCPSINSKDKADIHFERKLRAVVGETGEIDKAAAYEMAKGRKFIYEADSKDCCLIEMDESPPYPINQEAVQIALEVALLLKAKIVDEIQIMRKTVIDGSNVSGFQRTALIAYDGVLETSKGPIKIPIICLEEEAAQKIQAAKEYTKYRLDRLGIPLIEIATSPDIKDPEHAKETAEKLGMFLRSTGKVKRGIGTIRQDINISIKGKSRIELKGFQELKSIPAVLEKEVERQIKLSKKAPPEVRKVEPDNTTTYLRPMPGAARMYPETDVMPLKVDISKIKLSELIEEKTKRFEKLGLSKNLAAKLSKSDKVDLFEELIKKYKKIKPAFIAETLISYNSEILKKHKKSNPLLIKDKDLEQIFEKLEKGNITKNSVIEILTEIALGKKMNLEKYKVAEIDLKNEIKKLISKHPGLTIGAYMGMIMNKFKGKIDGKKAMEILKKIIKIG